MDFSLLATLGLLNSSTPLYLVDGEQSFLPRSKEDKQIKNFTDRVIDLRLEGTFFDLLIDNFFFELLNFLLLAMVRMRQIFQIFKVRFLVKTFKLSDSD